MEDPTQLGGVSNHLGQPGLAAEDLGALTLNCHANVSCAEVPHLPGQHRRGPDRAAPVVDLGLRKVEGVLALYRARAHVVAAAVGNHLATAVGEHGQLRLGHVPARVRPDSDLTAVRNDPPAYGFEEELRALGLIDALVDVAF